MKVFVAAVILMLIGSAGAVYSQATTQQQPPQPPPPQQPKSSPRPPPSPQPPAPPAAIEPTDFRPFSDAQNWIVKEPVVYRVGVSNASVTVPRGFVTDFASIPTILQSIFQQNGPYSMPAVIHDYLYWTQACTRPEADRLLLLAMIENRVPEKDQTAISEAVTRFGDRAWTDNAIARAKGLIRVLPEQHIRPPVLVPWPLYQASLQARGVTEASLPRVSRAFCRRGSMPIRVALETP
jgi:hypothetical protein